MLRIEENVTGDSVR